MKFYCFRLVLLLVLNFHSIPALASSLILDEIVNMESSATKEIPPPNPRDLHPKWWEYFTGDEEQLRIHINTTSRNLQDLLVSLPYEEKAAAQPLVSKIVATLNALYQAKKNEAIAPLKSTPMLKLYSLEKQLEINKEIRKINLDIANEKDKAEQLNKRITKSEKNLDNMLVIYLGLGEGNSKKVITGLEIMATRVSVGLGQANLRIIENRIKSFENKQKRLNDELSYSKDHLDFHEFDEHQLEHKVTLSQAELERMNKELQAAESALLGAFNDNLSSGNNFYLLEQQVLQASVNKAYSWSKLAFDTLKVNVLMHLNERFANQNHDLRKDLSTWRENLIKVKQQSLEWQKAALKEQDRIRQEYAYIVAQNESDGQQTRINQSMRQGVLHILTTLELLSDQVTDTEWLLNLLEDHFQTNSSFLRNSWVALTDFIGATENKISSIMNYSLVKIAGIPITLYIILKVLVILGFSFWLSKFARAHLTRLGRKRADITESTLYSLGSLVHYSILLFGLMLSLSSIGLDFSNFIFLAGAVTFGISFGLQSVANNFFCGLRILFERRIKIGDDIELPSGHHGKVCEIHVQNTEVITNDGQKVIIPNSELIGNTLVNWTKNSRDYRRLHIPFSAGADCDKELVRKLVIEAALRVPCALKDFPEYSAPQVWLENFTSHSMDFKLVVWVNYKGETYTDSKEADFRWEIESAFRKHKIPLPHIDLHHLLHPKTSH